MSLTHKILARASGKPKVEPGEFIMAKVDLVMMHDLTGPMAIEAFEQIEGASIWDPSKVVVIFDHHVPAPTIKSAQLHKMLREFVRKHGISNFYDVGRGGICHQVVPEKGYVKPGDLIVGADSHTCTYGALGAFATGMGSTDIAAALAFGEVWLMVPEVVEVSVNGEFGEFVGPKDFILHMAGEVGADGATYKSLEFKGPAIRSMSIDGRMTICNMAIEMGAKTGIVEADERTLEYLANRARGKVEPVRADDDAEYQELLEFDVTGLEPQVACPHSVDNVRPISEVAGVEIDQAFIGSCTNGRLEDLREAARILRGRRIRDWVRLVVIPASQEIYEAALREGLAEVFVKAGGYFCPPTCGPCLGGHMGLLADGEVCISSSNRNFVGRMGSPKAKVYLASPATVAASAVEGRIADPREVARSG